MSGVHALFAQYQPGKVIFPTLLNTHRSMWRCTQNLLETSFRRANHAVGGKRSSRKGTFAWQLAPDLFAISLLELRTNAVPCMLSLGQPCHVEGEQSSRARYVGMAERGDHLVIVAVLELAKVEAQAAVGGGQLLA